MLKKTLLLVIIILIGHSSWASHLMGGEITWECQSNGQFIFQLKVYRDCNGINQSTFVSLDNEISTNMKNYMSQEKLRFQLVPPNNHHRNSIDFFLNVLQQL